MRPVLRRESPAAAQLVLDGYSELSGDRPPRRLLDFYRTQHAMIRATLALWHLDDPTVDDRSKWITRARTYLALAAWAAGSPGIAKIESSP